MVELLVHFFSCGLFRAAYHPLISLLVKRAWWTSPDFFIVGIQYPFGFGSSDARRGQLFLSLHQLVAGAFGGVCLFPSLSPDCSRGERTNF